MRILLLSTDSNAAILKQLQSYFSDDAHQATVVKLAAYNISRPTRTEQSDVNSESTYSGIMTEFRDVCMAVLPLGNDYARTELEPLLRLIRQCPWVAPLVVSDQDYNPTAGIDVESSLPIVFLRAHDAVAALGRHYHASVTRYVTTRIANIPKRRTPAIRYIETTYVEWLVQRAGVFLGCSIAVGGLVWIYRAELWSALTAVNSLFKFGGAAALPGIATAVQPNYVHSTAPSLDPVDADQVDCTALSPPQVVAGGSSFLHVACLLRTELDNVNEGAQSAVRSARVLATKLKRGARVTLIVDGGDDYDVVDALKSFVWTGKNEVIAYRIQHQERSTKGQAGLLIKILVDGLYVGRLVVEMRVRDAISGDAERNSVGAVERSHRSQSGFTSTATPTPTNDRMLCSVFGPAAVEEGGGNLFRACFHRPEDRGRVEAEIGQRAVLITTIVSNIELRPGGVVRLEFDGTPKLSADEAVQSFVWRGATELIDFKVHCWSGMSGSNLLPTLKITIDGKYIGRAVIPINSSTRRYEEVTTDVCRAAQAIQPVFISYAHRDWLRALHLSEGFRATKVSHFVDALHIESGEHWERRIFSELDSCKLFCVIWSHSAKRSEWVKLELRRAIDRQREDLEMRPEISVVPVFRRRWFWETKTIPEPWEFASAYHHPGVVSNWNRMRKGK